MAYASASDLLRYFGREKLAQVSAPLDTVVTGSVLEDAITNGPSESASYDEAVSAINRITEALEDAGALVDSYLTRYDTPVSDEDSIAVLRRRNADIAYYNLHIGPAHESVIQRKDDAIDWLKSIAAGKASLPMVLPIDERGSVSSRPLLRTT